MRLTNIYTHTNGRTYGRFFYGIYEVITPSRWRPVRDRALFQTLDRVM